MIHYEKESPRMVKEPISQQTVPFSSPVNTQRWQRFILNIMLFAAQRFQQMPHHKAMQWGERLGKFAHFFTRNFAKRPQKYAHRNLHITGFPHPEMSGQERDAFIRHVFIQFAKSMVDFLRAPALTDVEIESLIRIEGLEHIHAAREKGKGFIVASAHLGNWELAARCLVREGWPITVVAREPENSDFAGYVRQMRESGGYRVLYRGSSTIRQMLSLLRKNEGIALLPDQNSGDMFIPFFGIPAGTVAGPASLALHTGATLLVGYCVRLPDDTYIFRIHPPISTHSTGDKDADFHRIMTEVNQNLESAVREYPDQWLWIHNRWKSAFEEGNRNRAFPDGIPPDLWERWNQPL